MNEEHDMTADISVQVYSVRDAFAADPHETLTRLREIGFERVEPFDLTGQADLLEAALPGIGLAAPSAHNRLASLTDAELDIAFDAAARVGVTTIIDPGIGDGWDDADAVRRMADRLNAVAERAGTRGLRIGYHNHWWELVEIDGRHALELFADHLDPDVRLEVDVYWAEVGGADPSVLLPSLGSRVHFLHVKDGAVDRDPESQLPAGSGRARLTDAFAAAPDATRVIEFDSYAGDIFDGLAESLRYVVATASIA